MTISVPPYHFLTTHQLKTPSVSLEMVSKLPRQKLPKCHPSPLNLCYDGLILPSWCFGVAVLNVSLQCPRISASYPLQPQWHMAKMASDIPTSRLPRFQPGYPPNNWQIRHHDQSFRHCFDRYSGHDCLMAANDLLPLRRPHQTRHIPRRNGYCRSRL